MKLAHVTGTFEVNDLADTLQQLKQSVATTRDGIRSKNIERTKQDIRDSVTPDKFIIATINSIEELDHVTNTLVKRLRDWYALYDPEIEHEERDHGLFVSHIMEQAQRGRNTMGGTLTDDDRQAAFSQAQVILSLFAQREHLSEYLSRLMKEHTPNIVAVAGEMIGAKLMSLAGSLKRLSRMPAGTVQLLGAETALFRHLRNKKALPPKHGIIFNHELMQRAPKPKRGKIARTLADTMSIAARIDYFKGDFYGDKLLEKVEASTK